MSGSQPRRNRRRCVALLLSVDASRTWAGPGGSRRFGPRYFNLKMSPFRLSTRQGRCSAALELIPRRFAVPGGFRDAALAELVFLYLAAFGRRQRGDEV